MKFEDLYKCPNKSIRVWDLRVWEEIRVFKVPPIDLNSVPLMLCAQARDTLNSFHYSSSSE